MFLNRFHLPESGAALRYKGVHQHGTLFADPDYPLRGVIHDGIDRGHIMNFVAHCRDIPIALVHLLCHIGGTAGDLFGSGSHLLSMQRNLD
ncbi:hypothetical protein D3C73_1499450 [compost metagenome]